MRLLLDECLPRRLRNLFAGHDARTVAQMGWAGKRNGELLSLMVSGGFEVFITADQNLRYQQNITAAGIAVIVLVAPSNRLVDLVPLIPEAMMALTTIGPGTVVEVSPPAP